VRGCVFDIARKGKRLPRRYRRGWGSLGLRNDGNGRGVRWVLEAEAWGMETCQVRSGYRDLLCQRGDVVDEAYMERGFQLVQMAFTI